ncbi:unnamed protein product [Mytilus edulis]|uniref:C2H2-type domain-containing protein n=1 Tax=Mytilus edulis TaxID=6550 RepID=A0A8S3S859_MYTED|nr:unnamed protein product [Mytilus edulis]
MEVTLDRPWDLGTQNVDIDQEDVAEASNLQTETQTAQILHHPKTKKESSLPKINKTGADDHIGKRDIVKPGTSNKEDITAKSVFKIKKKMDSHTMTAGEKRYQGKFDDPDTNIKGSVSNPNNYRGAAVPSCLSLIRSHMVPMLPTGKILCKFCGEEFWLARNLQKHLTYSHLEKGSLVNNSNKDAYVSDISDDITAIVEKFREAFKLKFEQDIIKMRCPKCLMEVYLDYFDEHSCENIQLKNQVLRFCSVCKIGFLSESLLNAHIFFEHKDKSQDVNFGLDVQSDVPVNTRSLDHKELNTLSKQSVIHVDTKTQLDDMLKTILNSNTNYTFDEIFCIFEQGHVQNMLNQKEDQKKDAYVKNEGKVDEGKANSEIISIGCKICKTFTSCEKLSSHFYLVHCTNTKCCRFCEEMYTIFASENCAENHLCTEITEQLKKKNNVTGLYEICYDRQKDEVQNPKDMQNQSTTNYLKCPECEEEIVVDDFNENTKLQNQVIYTCRNCKLNFKSIFCTICKCPFDSLEMLYSHFYSHHQTDTKCCLFCRLAYIGDNHYCGKREKNAENAENVTKRVSNYKMHFKKRLKKQKCIKCEYIINFCTENTDVLSCNQLGCIACRKVGECHGDTCHICGQVFHSFAHRSYHEYTEHQEGVIELWTNRKKEFRRDYLNDYNIKRYNQKEKIDISVKFAKRGSLTL